MQEVIKVVAGGGKTSYSAGYMKSNKNGLYLAYNNSVTKEMSARGCLGLTIDSLFIHFIIPKFIPLVPLINNGSRVAYQADGFNGSYVGCGNIRVTGEGRIFNQNQEVDVSLSTSNDSMRSMARFNNSYFIKHIFGVDTLRISQEQVSGLAKYIINNHSGKLLKLMKNRFSYIIIDEAQDLNKHRELFAKLLHESDISTIVLGDEHQNINGGGDWFESIEATETLSKSHRCADGVCGWVRDNLSIDIHGDSKKDGRLIVINMEATNIYDDGDRALLYTSRNKATKTVVDQWTGPKFTIQKAKGSTIERDVVIIGKTMNRRFLYTAITRTTKCAYSTIAPANIKQ